MANFEKYNRRITIEKIVLTDDGAGGHSETWTTYMTTWASIEPLTGGLVYQTEMLQGNVTYRVKMRYRTGIQVTPNMRISYEHPYSQNDAEVYFISPGLEAYPQLRKYFRIISVLDLLEAQRELQLICTEIPAEVT